MDERDPREMMHAYKERGGPKRMDRKVVRLRIPFLGSDFCFFLILFWGWSDTGFSRTCKSERKISTGSWGSYHILGRNGNRVWKQAILSL